VSIRGAFRARFYAGPCAPWFSSAHFGLLAGGVPVTIRGAFRV